jgi:hypothetical protein
MDIFGFFTHQCPLQSALRQLRGTSSLCTPSPSSPARSALHMLLWWNPAGHEPSTLGGTPPGITPTLKTLNLQLHLLLRWTLRGVTGRRRQSELAVRHSREAQGRM